MGLYTHMTYRTWLRVRSQNPPPHTHTLREEGGLAKKRPESWESVHWLCSLSHPFVPWNHFCNTGVFLPEFNESPGIFSGTDPKISGKGFVSEALGTKRSSALLSQILSPVFCTSNRKRMSPSSLRVALLGAFLQNPLDAADP